MTDIWLISYLALWLLVLILILAIFTLARQVGLLNSRLGPMGARMTNAGPELGARAPHVIDRDINGDKFTLGQARGKPTLLLFVTTSCGSCISLMPAIRALWKSERDRLEVALVSLYSTEEETRQFVKKHKLTRIPCTASEKVSFKYQVASPPYGLLIDGAGIVRAKGIVNNAEHLESLLNVIELGHESMEEWRMSQRAADLQVAVDVPSQ